MNNDAWQLCCPVDIPSDSPRIMLAHGEGGRMMRMLIRNQIVSELQQNPPVTLDDAASLPTINGPLALTTDSFVVSPLFFPGGDIGSLCVYGTVNDLAVSGARPMYLTLSFILEEGLPIAVLREVLKSISCATEQVGVQVVAGDTKVVPRGAADGMFINTAGIGELINPIPAGPNALSAGDELIVTGPIGRHGIAVLCAREELTLQPPPISDCGSLNNATALLRQRLGGRLRAMRDATRGGLGAVLHEWADASGLTMAIHESNLPVSPDVRGASELLGLDPIFIANEGTMLVAVEQGASRDALNALSSIPETENAKKIGTVEAHQSTPVTITRAIGRPQPLDQPHGAPQPRIC